MAVTEKHPFEPFLPENARMLFLGSFPPQPHRWCMPFYYPNWINDFWRILGLIHFGDREHFCMAGEKRFDEAAIRAFCTRAGLAFYDTACEVRRLKDNASDAFLEVVTPSDIPALLSRIPRCDTLVTTGEKASLIVAQTFSCPVPPVGGWVDCRIQKTPDQVGGDGSEGGGGVDVRGSRGDGMGSGGDGGAIRTIRFWRMPSTSRAYPLSLEKKAKAYRRLFIPAAAEAVPPFPEAPTEDR